MNETPSETDIIPDKNLLLLVLIETKHSYNTPGNFQ